MKTRIFALTVMFIFLVNINVFAMEKLPPDVLNAFQDNVDSFQNQMMGEKDATHHLPEEEIYQMRDTGYRVYKIDIKKALNEENIDLYDALISTDNWHIPVSDRITYFINKVGGEYKLVGLGVTEEKDAISYGNLEIISKEKGLNDIVYLYEPGLHIYGFIGKTTEGSQLLSFNNNDELMLQKAELINGKELINEIKLKANEAKTIGFGGIGGLNFINNQVQILLFLLLIVTVIGCLFMYKKLKLQKK